MRSIKIVFLVGIFCFIVPRFVSAQVPSNQTLSITDAQIVEVRDTGKINNVNHGKITKVTLQILSGELKGKQYSIEDNTLPTPYQIIYKQGDSVIVTVSNDGRGNTNVYISDYDRRGVLFVLFGIFLLVILIVAQKQGLFSLIGMGVSFYVIAQFIIPGILAGNNAFVMTLCGSLIIIPSTYYLAHGFNKKTTVAVLGTLITLIAVAILSFLFSHWANLTGFASEEAVFLQNIYGSGINILNLLIAGILIGGLAVLNDVTISQASTVASLRAANNKLTTQKLYSHAMDVGRDHVASLVNTLILVYVGAALPLVLLFYNTHTDLSLILNQEIIATELVRTLVTSVGIIAAVPITTYLACIFER